MELEIACLAIRDEGVLQDTQGRRGSRSSAEKRQPEGVLVTLSHPPVLTGSYRSPFFFAFS